MLKLAHHLCLTPPLLSTEGRSSKETNGLFPGDDVQAANKTTEDVLKVVVERFDHGKQGLTRLGLQQC